MICSLISRRKNARGRDTEIQDQVRLQVGVGLIATGLSHNCVIHRCAAGGGSIAAFAASSRYYAGGRHVGIGPCIRIDRVGVRRDLGDVQRDIGLAGLLADGVCVAVARIGPHMEGYAALEIRQLKSSGAVASVEGPDEREQRVELADGQSLTIAHEPPFGLKPK